MLEPVPVPVETERAAYVPVTSLVDSDKDDFVGTTPVKQWPDKITLFNVNITFSTRI